MVSGRAALVVRCLYSVVSTTYGIRHGAWVNLNTLAYDLHRLSPLKILFVFHFKRDDEEDVQPPVVNLTNRRRIYAKIPYQS